VSFPLLAISKLPFTIRIETEDKNKVIKPHVLKMCLTLSFKYSFFFFKKKKKKRFTSTKKINTQVHILVSKLPTKLSPSSEPDLVGNNVKKMNSFKKCFEERY